MKILIVSRYKKQYAEHVLPFVGEQYASIKSMIEDLRFKIEDFKSSKVELFLLQGNYLKQWKALRRKIREFKPDVIHAHYGLSCLLTNLATRRVPVVSTYHGSDINLSKVRSLSKMAMRLSAWNVFVSERNMALAGAVEGKKVSLVPCGISLSEDQLQTREEARKALGWTVDEKKVLFAGAFDNGVKDPELAMQAIGNCKLEIGDLDLIELKGYSRSEVNALMCAVDCLLMTSKTEGSPQVIKEAMACGCPIVSVDVGDVAERTEGVEGCYVVNSREPKDIAEALKKAISFEGKTNGRDKIIEYGLTNELVAKRIIKIYEDIINK